LDVDKKGRALRGLFLFGDAMRNRYRLHVSLLATLIAAHSSMAAEPAPLRDLMMKVVEPTSNAVFYIGRETPQNDDEWKLLQGKALMLIESANLMLLPDRYQSLRSKNAKQWTADAKLLLESSQKAYAAANAKNAGALEELNDPLYTACSTCHEHFLPQR
jgi:cytochrome c556